MAEPAEILALNDGWTQIPPKEDGEYWFTSAKPWRIENAYDTESCDRVKISVGKRIAEVSWVDGKWRNPHDCLDVWDSESQHELIAAWRPVGVGELDDYKRCPPEINGNLLERRRVVCPKCGGVAGCYRNDKQETLNPVVCYSCGNSFITDFYFRDVYGRRMVGNVIEFEKEVLTEK